LCSPARPLFSRSSIRSLRSRSNGLLQPEPDVLLVAPSTPFLMQAARASTGNFQDHGSKGSASATMLDVMENQWNPDNQQSDPPSPPASPPVTPPVSGGGWAAPPGANNPGPGTGSGPADEPTTQHTQHAQGSWGAPYQAPAYSAYGESPYGPPSSSGNGDDSGKTAKRVLAGFTVVALMIGSGATGALLADRDGSSGPNQTVATVKASTEPASQSLAKVAAAVQPAVVSIIVSVRGVEADEGSGVIYKSDGTIITNNHVIATAATNRNATIAVKFANGETADARILGRDPATDIAAIKVDMEGLTAATIGTSSSLHVGDTVVALGSPLGLDGSVTSGIVSALHRTVNLGASEEDNSPFGGGGPAIQSSVADAIQTDAAINPGNSGGPLVDSTGAVVGINTAIASLGSGGSAGSIGVGFAIPIDAVTSVADQLIQGKTPQHAVLGVQILDDEDGALIQSTTEGGAADNAGLQEGDVVTKFGDTRITSADQLSAAVRGKKPGDKVTITYLRGDKEETVEVTLGSTST
jgi:putative serine protease PepD